VNENQEQHEALCPECGHAFKAYVDRLIQPEPVKSERQKVQCPVCGCHECRIGK